MDLKKEFQYYLDNQKELVKKYKDRYIVIKGQQVIGDYPTEVEAYDETVKEHELGTFLIQLCLPGKESTTTTFYTNRVLVA